MESDGKEDMMREGKEWRGGRKKGREGKDGWVTEVRKTGGKEREGKEQKDE